MDKKSVITKIKDAGVVGAGGAGFPTHVKVSAEVDTVIVNGAECEPLLYKDKEIMRLYPEEMISGLETILEITGAQKGIIGLKAKNKEAINKLDNIIKKYPKISMGILDDVYPSGDEVVTIYELTKRIVPPLAIPLEIGVVVSNSETFLNIHNAVNNNLPVTDTFITLTGDVEHPVTVKVPVGTLLSDILHLCGKINYTDPAFISGGPMMGSVTFDKDDIITKTCAGYIILSSDHPLILRKTLNEHAVKRIDKSVCDQCSYCTEFCPRYLLGHDLQPHIVMRSVGLSGPEYKLTSKWSFPCVECKLCTLFSCPEMLYPAEACILSKRELGKQQIKYEKKDIVLKAHPMREYRKVPTKRLIERLGLKKFDRPAHYKAVDFQPEKVVIPLSQHIGSPALPVVKEGDRVNKGDIIGKIEPEKLGAPVHASINGKVTKIDRKGITITAE